MNTNPPPPPTDSEEEIVHTDDAIIGKALRGSLIAALVISAVGAGVFFFLKRKPAPPPPNVTQISAPVSPQRLETEIPVTKFTDITKESGVHFVHNNGAYGEKLLPETMGGGVAFLDYDNDGNADLFFVNSTYWPWKSAEGKQPTTMALYRNDGKGKFTDVTIGSGLDVGYYGMGTAVGDYDNDGNVDILITGLGGAHLFQNKGGRFQAVTQSAGVGGSTNDWSMSAAFFDYDNDGRLDLFVCNYVKWSREIDAEVGYKIDGRTRAYGQPTHFEGAFARLYHNEGNGRFADVSEKSGLQVKNRDVAATKALGVSPVDIDDDGWIDLIVANDTVPNLVFLNNKNGTFREIGAASGVAFDAYGNTRGAMGIDTAWYRNDGKLGIGIGNFANEMTALYVQQNSPTNFADEAITEGVGPASRLLLKFGLFFFDYDLDGRLDLLTANGHLEEEIAKIQKSQRYAQPAQLFWNAGDRGFVTASTEKAGGDLFKPIVGRGSAYADIDNDGDLDVVFTQVGGAPLLLRNDQKLDHHWIRLKLQGSKSNRDAIGAIVKVRLGEKTLMRQVMPARSYLSQSELPITIGLGKSPLPDEVEIKWSGGAIQKATSVKIDAVTLVAERP